MPNVCYMDPPFGSPILSSSRRLSMAQLILSSPDPSLAASSDSVTTIPLDSSFFKRIKRTVLLVYSAQSPVPVTNLVTLTDACVACIEPDYPSDISEDMLILLISSILSLRESAIIDAPIWPSQLNNDNSSLPDLEQQDFSSPGPSAPDFFQQQQSSAAAALYSPTDGFMRLSAHSDPNKPRFTLLEPATLRLSLRAWDNYTMYGPLSLFECLSPSIISALRKELNLAVIPRDNYTLRPLLVSLLTEMTHETMVESFRACKMANTKHNFYESTDPISMYNYLQRFFTFIDSNEVFFETEFPIAKDRYNEHSRLFCSGISPECLRSSMLLTHRCTHSLQALKARWVTLIEKVRLAISIKAQNSKTNKAYKEKRDSFGQSSGLIASNTAQNSGPQKPANHPSSHKPSDTAYPRQQPKTSQAGGARVNTVQLQKKNIAFEASVRSGHRWPDGTIRTAAQVYNKSQKDKGSKNLVVNPSFINHFDEAEDDEEAYTTTYEDQEAVNNKFTNNNNNIFAILDSGSSIHTVPNSSYLTSVSPVISGVEVVAANGSPIAVKECGIFKLNDDFVLDNTFIAPSIPEPIISVPNLVKDDNIIICSPENNIIIKNSIKISAALNEFISLATNSSHLYLYFMIPYLIC